MSGLRLSGAQAPCFSADAERQVAALLAGAQPPCMSASPTDNESRLHLCVGGAEALPHAYVSVNVLEF